MSRVLTGACSAACVVLLGACGGSEPFDAAAAAGEITDEERRVAGRWVATFETFRARTVKMLTSDIEWDVEPTPEMIASMASSIDPDNALAFILRDTGVFETDWNQDSTGGDDAIRGVWSRAGDVLTLTAKSPD